MPSHSIPEARIGEEVEVEPMADGNAMTKRKSLSLSLSLSRQAYKWIPPSFDQQPNHCFD
jgi:hypothetical protein